MYVRDGGVEYVGAGYSHADRVTDPALLQPERIQQVICEGKDIFGMLPEAYRVRLNHSFFD